MTGIICLVIIGWNFLGAFILRGYEDNSLVFINQKCDKAFPYLNPVWLWRNYKLNIIGILLLTILFNIMCPILSILYWTCKFIEWICTVGRK